MEIPLQFDSELFQRAERLADWTHDEPIRNVLTTYLLAHGLLAENDGRYGAAKRTRWIEWAQEAEGKIRNFVTAQSAICNP